MILKSVANHELPTYQRLYDAFNKIIIESITKVEDSVKVVITQLIVVFLDKFFED